ncbi:hypothetical protein CKO42_09050 [Lamprobacter modestohalophilus]|uniref:Uncharacterized protein n=1 Tax=Lamprobacter modestohalophilus TaxID=1064514 RepID=A0A9X0W7Q8_9GAMM|nr:hypothetical protein [Lamprobacter modestohalophilus]
MAISKVGVGVRSRLVGRLLDGGDTAADLMMVITDDSEQNESSEPDASSIRKAGKSFPYFAGKHKRCFKDILFQGFFNRRHPVHRRRGERPSAG